MTERALKRRGAMAAFTIALVSVAFGPTAVQAQAGPRTYRPPVVAPVTDPFRPPPRPWASGNRGIEYATWPGTLVRAIGPGRVAFAGAVAGSLYVTVLHPDGLRSSYSFLASVRVRVGSKLASGAIVGVAGSRLHLGVRRGTDYLNPASLWGTRVGGGRVVLVPMDGGPANRHQSGAIRAAMRLLPPLRWW